MVQNPYFGGHRSILHLTNNIMSKPNKYDKFPNLKVKPVAITTNFLYVAKDRTLRQKHSGTYIKPKASKKF